MAGDEDYVLEPCMLEFGDNHLYRPAVGHVARQFQIVDWQMRCKRVYDDLKGLLQRQMIFVVSPTYINKMEAVCGDGRGVHGAVFVLAHPLGAEPEKIHPVLLGDILRQSRNTGTRERMHGRCLHQPLPLLYMGVGATVKEQVVSEREHVLCHLKVATKHLLEIIQEPGRLGDAVQKPRGAIHSVQVAACVFHSTPMPGPGQGLDFGKVPIGGEYQLATLFGRRVEVGGVRVEPHVVVNNAPVLMGVMLLAVLVNRVWLRGGVPPSAVVVDADLVYGAGLGRSSCSHGCRSKY